MRYGQKCKAGICRRGNLEQIAGLENFRSWEAERRLFRETVL